MEMLDVVNEKDEVVGKAEYSEVYKNFLAHRICHILIFNDKGEMALQLRSKHKRFCPNHWVTAVGGHVQSGESYEQAALREMEEEVGVQIPVEFLRKDRYDNPERKDFTKFLGTFKAKYNGPFRVNPEEVDRVEFFSMEKIKQMIADGEKFHPELLFLLRKEFGVQ
ncbi:NUDIX domain-containing protein [Candidatus Woesearchaeota archaeon]|nr:NUDIX domain-containing protein [Candidatus Woesearchaeota archaeon]